VPGQKIFLPDCMAISTSGAYAKPAWLNILIDKGYEIFCGFDNDETGDILANKMIRFFPTVKRLRPPKHDWNEILVSKYKKRRKKIIQLLTSQFHSIRILSYERQKDFKKRL